MSAIDNAFIRAYTLDADAGSATAQGDYDDVRPAMAPAARTVAVSQPGLAKHAVPVAKAPHRSAGPADRLSAETAHPIVPAPHIRLASFIHTTMTFDPSPTIHDSATLEIRQIAPAATAGPMDADPLLPEEPATDFGLPDLATLSPGPAAKSLPSALPSTAAVAAKSALEEELPRAAFEIEQFAWPKLCDALLEARAIDFEQLVGQLVTESAMGRKVVAITGSRRGDGRTTLAISLARRLAASAVKVVLVDADFEAPQLAPRLGMTVQSGWEKVLTDGLPVWEGLVESLNDRLSLLPLAPRSVAQAGQTTAADFVLQYAPTIGQHLETLRKHFDVVLVDAGAVKAARPDGKPRGPLALAGSLDSAVIVSDARVAAPGRIADLQRRLLEARIIPLGIAENFCPAKPD